MNFKRSILTELKQWAERSNRKPLIMRGARQVGKTTAVKLFSQEFDHFIPLNLELPGDREMFTRFDRLEDIVAALLFRHDVPRHGKRVLLFIDEIQNEPMAVAQLRYFYEHFPDLYVIAAGSLLETLLESKNTFPVGRVEYMVLRPVSFREFLQAIGEEAAAGMLGQVPLPAYAQPKLMQLFHQYALIGGMPEVVEQFSENRDLTALKPIYTTLLTAYQDDVQKYEKDGVRAQVIQHCIRHLLLEAGGRIKFEGFGNAGYGSREVGEALRTLEKAMLLHLVYPTVEAQLPGLPDHRKMPYLQALDTGLVNFFSGIQESLIGTKDLHEAYRGRIIHHWVGQQLLANMNSPLDSLRFWVREKKQSSAEVDFLFPFRQILVPVEVKAGATGKLRSLHQFMEICDHPFAIRLYAGELLLQQATTPSGKTFHLLNLPYFLGENLGEYMAWFQQAVKPT
ncbi:MAG: AAA family ATPase [Saprospiraceae bacterium]|nr:AAA family ATPase [Saprospiraceae bacterium]MCF8248703.1 AAA family ATPase [Saprospiraceae bacterium]MCF8278807.1 AAA family ATPase [Bacteroidales bacterium]MCF8310607.1 AAA family ATPase [Saprospiraceae bacterium]MCF8439166.1 AAA family ATPase [Saprospiraceae bacterium]